MILCHSSLAEGCPLRYNSPNCWAQVPPVYYNAADYYAYYYQPQQGYDYHHLAMMPDSPGSVESSGEESNCSLEHEVKTGSDSSPAQCCWRGCGMWLESLSLLADHVSKMHAISGSGGLFYCEWDGCNRNLKGFNAKYKMLIHVRTHTNEKPHQCCLCKKSFSRSENLKIHARSHSGEKPYTCPVAGCNKAYSNSSDRFKHTRTHQVDKPYVCKVPGCVKRYTDPSSLRKHLKTYSHVSQQQKATAEVEAPIQTTAEDEGKGVAEDAVYSQYHPGYGFVWTQAHVECHVPLDLRVNKKY